MATAVLINSNIPNLKLLSKGKVRDIYATSSPEYLLFVASDRISAYDVILKNGIPDKGRILTELSLFWFDKLRSIVPNHVVTSRIEEMPEELHEYREQLEGRSVLVKKAEVIPLEAIVRGYITGSAWAEYKKTRTVHEIPLPEDLQESQKLPTPLFTPSPKQNKGRTTRTSPLNKLYTAAAEHAATRGLIIADTKFEFGIVGGDLTLIDEALTPDSSRYWPLEGYTPGRSQRSFDKQYLRDWLTSQGFQKVSRTARTDKAGQ
ncbi:phosphoribosylaminoimidazole-succinocarboxamide synthase [Russula emetica]|nr:phosphoribosylaminoimidazole-succinocarboxamide synthase [Russula emetica]